MLEGKKMMLNLQSINIKHIAIKETNCMERWAMLGKRNSSSATTIVWFV
jgi:hypothetical protein